MSQDVFKQVGICGIYCGTCPMYLAYRKNDSKQLDNISKEWGLPIEEIPCDGCHSDKLFSPCRECRHGFRECAKQKGVTWCFQCPDFPCSRLEDFRDIHVVNGISHHDHVIEDLKDMKEQGVEQWVEEQNKNGCCPRCGTMLYWFVLECPDCHIQIR